MRQAAVDRVVEDVAGDGVGGFEQPGDDEVGAGHRERRQQRPDQLGGDAARLGEARPVQPVPEGALVGDEVPDEVGEPAHALAQLDVVEVGAGRQGDGEHAEAVDPVDDRHPQLRSPPGQPLPDRLDGPERPAGDARVDGLGGRRRLARGERDEAALFVVDEVDGDRPPDRGAGGHDDPVQPVRRDEVRPVEQRGQQERGAIRFRGHRHIHPAPPSSSRRSGSRSSQASSWAPSPSGGRRPTLEPFSHTGA